MAATEQRIQNQISDINEATSALEDIDLSYFPTGYLDDLRATSSRLQKFVRLAEASVAKRYEHDTPDQ